MAGKKKKRQIATPPEAAGASPAGSPAGSRVASLVVYATVFTTGGTILVLELLGTRVLAPAFGLSLYVWTALISVTLMALAVGYHLGGILCDRRPGAAVMYSLIGMAGLWVLLLLAIRDPVLASMAGWETRLATLSAAAALFFVPLALLAMVGPYAVKLLTRDLGKVGRGVGSVSGVSTIGSVLGAIATGYLLIPELGVRDTLAACGILLAALAALGLLLARKGVLVALAGLSLAFGSGCEDSYPRHVSPGVELLFEKSSPYADVKVVDTFVDHEKRTGAHRILFIGHGFHSMKFEDDSERAWPHYVDAMPVVRAMRPDLRTVLIVGLGGGDLVREMEGWPQVEIDIVEIDPVVVHCARRYFGFVESERVRLFVMDGRRFFKRPPRRYDLVLFDAFGAGTAPFHLFTLEALREMKGMLEPGGLLFLNYLGFAEGTWSRAILSVLRTVKEVFPQVRVVLGNQPDEKRRWFANYTVLASERPVRLVHSPLVHARKGTRERLKRLLEVNARFARPGSQTELPAWGDTGAWGRLLDVSGRFDPSRGSLVTDDLNPIEREGDHQNREITREALGHFPGLFLGR